MKKLKSSDFIPLEKYTILTNLSEEEVLLRLRKIIGNPDRRFQFSFMGIDLKKHSNASFDYEGTISDNAFKISRVIRYRNSFLPVIKGTVSSFVNKTEIHISMKMHLVVRIFMIIWLSLTGIPSLIILLATCIALTKFNFQAINPILFLVLGMFLFGYCLMLLAFKAEAKKAKKDLNILWEAESDKLF